jgi:L1 cell adhesion molecule like protein
MNSEASMTTNNTHPTSTPEPVDSTHPSEKFKAEDEAQKERISAKNGLESYCFNMKSTVDDDKFKDKISESDHGSDLLA